MNDVSALERTCLEWQCANYGTGVPIHARDAFEAGARTVGCDEDRLKAAEFDDSDFTTVEQCFIAGAEWASGPLPK